MNTFDEIAVEEDCACAQGRNQSSEVIADRLGCSNARSDPHPRWRWAQIAAFWLRRTSEFAAARRRQIIEGGDRQGAAQSSSSSAEGDRR